MNDNDDEVTPNMIRAVADSIESNAKEGDKVAAVIGNMYGKKGLTPTLMGIATSILAMAAHQKQPSQEMLVAIASLMDMKAGMHEAHKAGLLRRPTDSGTKH